MSHFVIEGGKQLSGEIPVFGSKNAALPLIAASLLTAERVTISNIPAIADIYKMSDILSSIGVEVEYDDQRLSVHAKQVSPEAISIADVGALRGSILLLGALLGRTRSVKLPLPGGDIIGARPIDVHLDGFAQLGAAINEEDDIVTIDGANLAAGRVVLREFSVTATENMMLVCATLPGTSTIEIAAAEPHIVALAEMLNAMGAEVTGAGTHTITITGSKSLHGATVQNIQDMLEAGLFILLAAATHSTVTVKGVPVNDLLLFFKKLDDIGIAYDVQNETEGVANVHVTPSQMRSFKIQTLPYPGIATDLQATFSVIATQVQGSSLIHDPMYEGRFKHITELSKMGADAVMCDPHRVIISGPTPLKGRRIPSLDIRAGATLLMAGLVAQGQTVIDNAEIIDRGYANLTERLQAIGADISREE
ncbi:MAG: UDP-N-acetylglucosamine 1-carboxyvinyltransferase [Candidatus Andersenbacteria bacterium]